MPLYLIDAHFREGSDEARRIGYEAHRIYFKEVATRGQLRFGHAVAGMGHAVLVLVADDYAGAAAVMMNDPHVKNGVYGAITFREFEEPATAPPQASLP
jgi:uncharacterized protein YciI